MTRPTKTRVRVGVLISGAGSNMAALIDAAAAPDAPFDVVVVVSNLADAAGLAVAKAKGVSAVAVEHRAFGPDREAHERALDRTLTDAGVEVVALAGYMRLLTPWLVRRWEGRMLNIHPSLLPKYPGLDTHARVLAAGDETAGCTVHLVSEGVDEGPILAQAEVPVLPGDTPMSLAQRVLQAEHQLYPRALAAFVDTRIRNP